MELVIVISLAVNVVLGVLYFRSTRRSSKTTADGTLKIIKTRRGTTFSLEVDGDPEYELEGKSEVVFKVEKDG